MLNNLKGRERREEGIRKEKKEKKEGRKRWRKWKMVNSQDNAARELKSSKRNLVR